MANKTVPSGQDPRAFCEAIDHPGRRQHALRLLDLFGETTGFSPRKANLVVYIMPGYTDFAPILARLGPHKLGKSCLYLGRLSKIDEAVLAELIRAGLAHLSTRWTIHSA